MDYRNLRVVPRCVGALAAALVCGWLTLGMTGCGPICDRYNSGAESGGGKNAGNSTAAPTEGCISPAAPDEPKAGHCNGILEAAEKGGCGYYLDVTAADGETATFICTGECAEQDLQGLVGKSVLIMWERKPLVVEGAPDCEGMEPQSTSIRAK